MKEPDILVSKGGYTMRILQVGWAGIILGRTDITFEGQSIASVETDLISVDRTINESFTVEKLVS